MRKNRTEIIEYINGLKGYRGYVQFSHRKIDIKRDLFDERDPMVEEEAGFVYEAHFCNNSESIMIRQQNGEWVVSSTDLSSVSEEDVQTYAGIGKFRVKMAQIWENRVDNLCENMEVKRVQKVVFAGLSKGESK